MGIVKGVPLVLLMDMFTGNSLSFLHETIRGYHHHLDVKVEVQLENLVDPQSL